MAINVVCPGCLKRFQVSDRFAGMKGPCPNCNTMIDIPKGKVKIHGAEDFEHGGRSATGRILLKPIERLDMDFNPARAGLIGLGVLAVFLVAFLVGRMSLSVSALNLIGTFGLLLTAFPLSLFGHQILREREQLFMLTGRELYWKAGLCALAYVLLWILYESTLWYMRADLLFTWVYFAIFAVLAMLAAHAILDMNLGNALLHCLIFAVSTMLLRGLIGLGWLWNVTEPVRHGTLPPPPVLPGM